MKFHLGKKDDDDDDDDADDGHLGALSKKMLSNSATDSLGRPSDHHHRPLDLHHHLVLLG